MNKLQKVKFHRGDRRPGDNSEDTLTIAGTRNFSAAKATEKLKNPW